LCRDYQDLVFCFDGYALNGPVAFNVDRIGETQDARKVQDDLFLVKGEIAQNFVSQRGNGAAMEASRSGG
jgi:hypothetical protein